MEIKEIIELMQAFSENGLTNFQYEKDGECLSMKKKSQTAVNNAAQPVVVYGAAGVPAYGAGQVSGAGVFGYAAAETAGQGSADMTAASQAEEAGSAVHTGAVSDKVITCPLVGTFYSSPSPDAEDFVKVGDTVKKGQVIGIVEAMKLMNEIESDYDGVVDAILVKNEDTVEYGQPLFRIR